MFGMRSTSASYGNAYALANVSTLVPTPSGGTGQASVHNSSLDLMANDTPSTFLVPSSHPGLAKSNDFNEGDVVFSLNPRGGYPKYDTDYKAQNRATVPLVTVTKLNSLLQEFAANAEETDPWWEDPDAVARWARPIGVVLNKMRVNVGTSMRNSNSPQYGLNICVSRRVNIKHNFMTIKNGGQREWFAQSTMAIAVQYSNEHYLSTEHSDPCQIVVVCMVLLDGDTNATGLAREGPVTVQPDGTVGAGDLECFKRGPLRKDATILQIGRVLNSCTISPTAFKALHSNFNKILYDSLLPIEVELGCN